MIENNTSLCTIDINNKLMVISTSGGWQRDCCDLHQRQQRDIADGDLFA